VITFRPSAKFDQQGVVILLDQGQAAKEKFSCVNKRLVSEIKALIQAKQFSGADGELFPVMWGRQICLLAGVGEREKISAASLRITIRKAFLSSFLSKVKDVEVIPHEQNDAAVKAVIEAVLIGTYAWKKYRTKDKKDTTVDDKNVVIVTAHKKQYDDTATVCEGVNFARDLINDNADTITSEYMEQTIRRLIKGRRHISVEVLNRKEMRHKGLGLHLAVNQGSLKEPKLIIVRYHGSAKKGDYTAIVGKGMTFDSGGLNLKPTGSIETMRSDMSGAAAVAGVLKNAIALNLKTNVIFACAMAENAIDSASYKPGDVIKGCAGKTVEVANTDAEGRLVLADAIAYVNRNYKPARLIDIATLTGACVVALGHDYSGVVSTDEKLAAKLLHAARETDDRAWRMPHYPELKDAVKSQIADIKNTGFPKGAGGIITAAEFLRQFTDGLPWAHLDIAGTAFTEGQGRMYFGPGATGAGVRLLTEFLMST
jgi:leucyl aminopeptidase